MNTSNRLAPIPHRDLAGGKQYPVPWGLLELNGYALAAYFCSTVTRTIFPVKALAAPGL